MAELHSVVCMKVVPKPEEIRVDTHTGWLKREAVRSEINPPDMNAMEMALQLKDHYGGQVDIVSMGPTFFIPYLQVALAMGADHIYLLSDRVFAGADTLATTYTLAQGIRRIGEVDLIFCGEESSDGATGQVPPGIAEWLGFSQLTVSTHIELGLDRHTARGRREIKGGTQVIEVPLPAVVSMKTVCNEPRFMDYSIKEWAFQDERITMWSNQDLQLDEHLIGENGSPTTVSKLIQAPEKSRKRVFLEGNTQELVSQLTEILQGGS
jgi:electron transfer flavoprotein beta subunit